MKSRIANSHLPLVTTASLSGDMREQGASQRGLRPAPHFFHALQSVAREAIGGLGFGT